MYPLVPRSSLSMRAEEHTAAEAEEEAALEKRQMEEAAAARSPAAIALVREQAESCAAKLREDEALVSLLEKGGTAPTGKMAKMLKKPKGTMALIGEGVQLDVVSMGGYDLDDPVYLSCEFREGGCVALSVSTAERSTLRERALEETVREQESVRGDFPGPIPVIVRDDIVDPIQLAAAAAGGAKMCFLPMVLIGSEAIGGLMAEATRLGLDPIARVADDSELEAALAAGAKMVCIGDVAFSQAEELLSKLPADVISIADFEVRDVRGVWKVRDLGFNALIIGKSLMDICVRDRVPPAAVIKAMLSKVFATSLPDTFDCRVSLHLALCPLHLHAKLCD
ncbi:MAG: hypothetical protein SGPRY_000728 [Prymnesium sp.]